MAKKQPLTPDEVTELFSELDESGVLDPSRVSNRDKRLKFRVAAQEAGDSESLGKLAKASGRSKTRAAIDPLSGDDPSGSKVDTTISRTAIGFIVVTLVLIVGLQIGYGVSRRLNTSNLSETVTQETVTNALRGGLEWGNGFTQFPSEFTVDRADERTGVVEVSVVETDAANELELFSNSQLQATALATNALLNDNIDQVVYNVSAIVDDDGNIQRDRLLGMLPATGNDRSVFTFIWTKNKSETSANIDWELRIVGIDEDIAARIQEQVNSVSSLIEEDPAISQDDLEDQQFESALEQGLKGSEAYTGGAAEKAPADAMAEAGIE